jgi:hypothetical protein
MGARATPAPSPGVMRGVRLGAAGIGAGVCCPAWVACCVG